ncbi:MAG: hypothetical protein ACXVXC_16955 [Nocardioidaceae bacterium]
MTTSTFHRTAAATGLVGAALLLAASVALQPALSGGAATMLAAIAAAGPRAAVSAGAFALAQLPFIVGVLGIGRLLRERSPRLGAVGTSLGVVGGFGHAVYGGVSLAVVAMAQDPSHRPTYAHLMDRMQASPLMLFALMGLAGSVLGLLLLSIGLFRGHVGPRWLGPVLWAYLVVEFVGGSVSDSAAYLSGVLLTVAFLTLAREVRNDGAGPVQVAAATPESVA